MEGGDRDVSISASPAGRPGTAPGPAGSSRQASTTPPPAPGPYTPTKTAASAAASLPPYTSYPPAAASPAVSTSTSTTLAGGGGGGGGGGGFSSAYSPSRSSGAAQKQPPPPPVPRDAELELGRSSPPVPVSATQEPAAAAAAVAAAALHRAAAVAGGGGGGGVAAAADGGSGAQRDYDRLQRELKEKFAILQREYADREAAMRQDFMDKVQTLQEALSNQEAQHKAAAGDRAAEWARKEADMRQLHEVVTVQQTLMEEQLQALKRREESALRLEGKQGDALRAREAELAALEQALADKERSVQEREMTAAHMEKQQAGLQRLLQKASFMTVAAVNTDLSFAAQTTDCLARNEEAGFSRCVGTDNAATCAAFAARGVLAEAAAQTCAGELDEGCDGDLAAMRAMAAELDAKKSRAEAMWTSARRREQMLGEWEARLAAREEQSRGAGEHLQRLGELAERLAVAVKAAEVKLLDQYEECLARKMHRKEKASLMYPSQRAAAAAAAGELQNFASTSSRGLVCAGGGAGGGGGSLGFDQQQRCEELALWEREMLSLRDSLHEMCILVKNALHARPGPSVDGAAAPGSPTSASAVAAAAAAAATTAPPPLGGGAATLLLSSEQEVRARALALQDKEARFDEFLRKEVDTRSLEAQKFEAAERQRALNRQERELEDRQQAVNESVVRVSQREVKARQLEQEASKVITRLDASHRMKAALERKQDEIRTAEAVVAQRSHQAEREFDKMRQRWELLRDRERRFAQECGVPEGGVLGGGGGGGDGSDDSYGGQTTQTPGHDLRTPATPPSTVSPSPFLKRHGLPEPDEDGMYSCLPMRTPAAATATATIRPSETPFAAPMASAISKITDVDTPFAPPSAAERREKKRFGGAGDGSIEDAVSSISKLLDTYAKSVSTR